MKQFEWLVLLASLWWLMSEGERPSQRQLAQVTGVDAMMASQVLRKLDVHATLAAERRWSVRGTSLTAPARDHQRREAEWHEEMSRRFERAKWLPWPFGPYEPARPE